MSARILVIDDETRFRSLVRMALEASGHTVGEASDGPAGLLAFGDGSRWDLVLLDQRMPGMDGLEVLRRIREKAPATRIVMVTAHASIELAVDALKLGATDFVRKPMAPEVLRRSITAALAGPAGAGGAKVPPRPASASTSAAPPAPLVERLTVNGYRIQPPDDPAYAPTPPGQWRFLVRSPGGGEQTVLVALEPGFLREVGKRSRRILPLESPFWFYRAESRLAAHVWETGQIPDSPLRISEATLEDIEAASRWGSAE